MGLTNLSKHIWMTKQWGVHKHMYIILLFVTSFLHRLSFVCKNSPTLQANAETQRMLPNTYFSLPSCWNCRAVLYFSFHCKFMHIDQRAIWPRLCGLRLLSRPADLIQATHSLLYWKNNEHIFGWCCEHATGESALRVALQAWTLWAGRSLQSAEGSWRKGRMSETITGILHTQSKQ